MGGGVSRLERERVQKFKRLTHKGTEQRRAAAKYRAVNGQTVCAFDNGFKETQQNGGRVIRSAFMCLRLSRQLVQVKQSTKNKPLTEG